MSKVIYRCEICEKEYDSQELAEKCEETHNKIQDQIGINRDDSITFKNWTAFGYQGNRLLFNADDYDIYRKRGSTN